MTKEKGFVRKLNQSLDNITPLPRPILPMNPSGIAPEMGFFLLRSAFPVRQCDRVTEKERTSVCHLSASAVRWSVIDSEAKVYTSNFGNTRGGSRCLSRSRPMTLAVVRF